MRSALAIGAASLLVVSAARADEDWVRLQDQTPPVRLSRPASEPEPAPVAPEEPAPPFGERGTFAITAGSSVGVSWTKFESDASSFRALFSPGVDYFFLKNASVGIDLIVGYADERLFTAEGFVRTETTRFGGGPRFALNVPLGASWSWYPRVTLGVESVRREATVLSGPTPSALGTGAGARSSTAVGPWVSVYAPLLVHPKPHFFLGLGPGLFRDFGRVQNGPELAGERTSWFASVVVGGFWGGTTPPATAEPPTPEPREETPPPGEAAAPAPEETPPPTAPAIDAPAPTAPVAPRPRRFGDPGEVVFSGELGASADVTSYGGTNAKSHGVSFSPAFDVFTAPHISIGISASIFTRYAFEQQPDTPGVKTTRGGGGLAGRFGVDIPFASWLSFYPRASIGITVDDVEVQAGTASYQYTTRALGAGLYAPVLVHPASHFFVGFGPRASGDLVRTYSPRDVDNRGYSVGADLVVGGWL